MDENCIKEKLNKSKHQTNLIRYYKKQKQHLWVFENMGMGLCTRSTKVLRRINKPCKFTNFFLQVKKHYRHSEDGTVCSCRQINYFPRSNCFNWLYDEFLVSSGENNETCREKGKSSEQIPETGYRTDEESTIF